MRLGVVQAQHNSACRQLMHAVTELLGDETGQVFDPERFRKRMLDLCRDHHREKRALVFAFLIYDFDDPQIIKVLQDPDYWAALDHISGSTITVFACNSPEPTGPRDNRAVELRSKLESVLSAILGSQIIFKSPSILFFQVADQQIVGSLFASLDERNVEESFNEIRDIIERASKSLVKVTDDNRGNVAEIFQLVEQTLSQRQLFRRVIRGIPVIRTLTSVLSSLGGLYG